jgi:acetyl esterase/lipase
MEFARRLAMAGVPVELFIVPGAFHGFDIVAPKAQLTVEFEHAWQSALRRGLGLRQ